MSDPTNKLDEIYTCTTFLISELRHVKRAHNLDLAVMEELIYKIGNLSDTRPDDYYVIND